MFLLNADEDYKQRVLGTYLYLHTRVKQFTSIVVFVCQLITDHVKLKKSE